MDARKWSAKWRNWNISDIFFSLSSIEGKKQQRQLENICTMYGDNAIGKSMTRKLFSRFKEDHFDIIDTPRSGRPSGFDEDHLNTLIHNDPHQCTRELANVMNCDHTTIMQYLHSMCKVQKAGVCIPLSLGQNHKISGWLYVHLCLLVIYWLMYNIDHSYPVSLLVTKSGTFMLT